MAVSKKKQNTLEYIRMEIKIFDFLWNQIFRFRVDFSNEIEQDFYFRFYEDVVFFIEAMFSEKFENK